MTNTNTKHMLITTPEIHRAIIFFNWCFPEYGIQTVYNMRLQSFYAYSSSNNVDFNIMHNLRDKIKEWTNYPTEKQLEEAKQNLIKAQEIYNKLVNDMKEKKER